MWYFAAGDAGFHFAEQIRQMSWLPVTWHPEYGFGVSTVARLWFDYVYALILKIFSSIGFSWWFIDKLLWFAVFALSVCSAYKLASYILGNRTSAILASIIYVSNTYILLLFGGGQIGVSLAYAFAPLVFFRIIKYGNSNLREQIINGLCLALLVAFDLRIAFLVVAATVFWWYRSLIFLFVAASVHSFWILPIGLARGGISDLGEQFTSPGMLKFLSVADFSHALSLLHPNWPENLFGKVYFLQPEFLVLPLLAFSALLFFKYQITKNKKQILFFALLALLGAFFAKGVNEPFGGIYAWMFTHIPGFIMFRDPTKFYLYTAIGYSVLVPYTFYCLSHALKDFRYKQFIVYCLLIVFVFFWFFSLRAVFTGQVTGNFRPAPLPEEYVQLKDMLIADSIGSRTLWIPQKENYAFASDTHPMFATQSAFVKDPFFIEKISRMGVRYVIVPPDVYKRLFLTDYRYDPSLRTGLIDTLQQTSLKQNRSFSDIAVFENDRFIFERNTPVVVEKQQKLANIGLVISVISMVIFGWAVSKKQ